MSNPIGALLPASTQPITRPYITPAQFAAYPTWLDLTNLVPNGLASLQTDDLSDVLLAASSWADDVCEGMRLSAHLVTGENITGRVSGGGRVTIQPRDIPVCSVTALSYGWSPDAQTALALAPGVIRDEGGGKLLSFRTGGGSAFIGPAIQFGGGPVGLGGQAYVTWSYVAGFVTCALSASCAKGASSVTVDDPTGIMPGQTLRIYDEGEDKSGASEALTLSATYVPQVPTVPPTATSIPLASPTLFAHGEGTGLTGMPRTMLQAVIVQAVALLMRTDVSGEEPSSDFGPAARTTMGGDREAGAAGGLVNQAERWLYRFRPVWR